MPDPDDYFGTDQDPYIDKETGILKNIPEFSLEHELAKYEATMFQANFAEATSYMKDVKTFNLKHWQEVHRICFGDVYQWAGGIRTIRIAKGQTMFAYPETIENESQKFFDEINLLLEQDTLSFEKAVILFSEVNVLHPFREGNGRTQRILFTEIFSRINYKIDYSKTSQEEMIEAMIKAYNGNYENVQELFERIAEEER